MYCRYYIVDMYVKINVKKNLMKDVDMLIKFNK